MSFVQSMVAAFGLVREGIAATCVTSRLELVETAMPTKRRQWRSGKRDASPSLPLPLRLPRD